MPRTLLGVVLQWSELLSHLLQHSPAHRTRLEELCVQAGTTLPEWYQRTHSPDYQESARMVLHGFMKDHPTHDQWEIHPQQEHTASSYVVGCRIPNEFELDMLGVQLPQARQRFQALGLTAPLRFYTLDF